MINNRQGGRRRGRGGQRERGQNLGGGQPGNRQDNRQRGNAAQLLEKYKSMARDSQLSGDRVQTEYYLQFAEHYFRVLGESRARFEDQNPRRSRDDEMDEDDESGASDNEPGFHRGEEELAEAGDEASPDERSERSERPDRPYRNERFDRPDRQARDERPADDEDRRPRRPRTNGGDDSLPLDVLPPAIGREPPAEEAEAPEEQPRRPRRRAARPARPADGDDDIAPAA
ncbi:DUF4167 domain-containing protein [Sphingomonas sp.]|uniref:DUF4167 domain-containing protein n=1 Tax=Sphingomonas sp. TaxID=28214 RepID=UPI0038A6D146